MRRRQKRKLVPWCLILAGTFLLFAGARVLFESYWGQHEAAEDWALPYSDGSARHSDLGPAVARLSIPRLDASWFVFEGTGHKQLRLGPGHMLGSAMPGAAGNCIIAGHRDTHFRVLKDVRPGDEIHVNTGRGEFIYRVTRVSVVSPGSTAPLRPTTSAVMNLITCYPFYYVGPAPKRFVVQAQLAQPS